MKKIISLLCLLILSTFTFAAPISHMVVLGDSSSDDGNLFKLSSGAVPQFPPYFNGRFSNGPTWAELLGKYLFDKNNASYKIYSYGGATARSFEGDDTLNLEAEVKAYLADPATPTRENVLFMLWIGINDYLNDDSTDAEVLTSDVIAALDKNIQTLVDHGGKYFVVINTPDLSQAPLTKAHPEKAARLHQLFTLHNKKLATHLREMKERLPGVTFVDVDIDAFWKEFLNAPQAFNEKYEINIKNTTDACLATEYVESNQATKFSRCTNPDEYVFWDFIHPTEVTHFVITKMLIGKLEANQLA